MIADVPFLSDFPHATMIADVDPYPEIARYLHVHRDHTEAVFATLAHFDVSILGRNASAPALLSVALMDQITPPSTVYAAFHAYGGPKELVEYPFNDHEGGGPFHDVAKLRWVRGHRRRRRELTVSVTVAATGGRPGRAAPASRRGRWPAPTAPDR